MVRRQYAALSNHRVIKWQITAVLTLASTGKRVYLLLARVEHLDREERRGRYKRS